MAQKSVRIGIDMNNAKDSIGNPGNSGDTIAALHSTWKSKEDELEGLKRDMFRYWSTTDWQDQTPNPSSSLMRWKSNNEKGPEPEEDDRFWLWCMSKDYSAPAVSNKDKDPDDHTSQNTTDISNAQPIVLKVSLQGEGTKMVKLANPEHFGSVLISGRVQDKDGNGVKGADIEVVDGATPAAITTKPDGSFVFAVDADGDGPSGTQTGLVVTLDAILGDLRFSRIVLLQAIEEGKLVAGRDVGVRVFMDWKHEEPVKVSISAKIDGKSLPETIGTVKNKYSIREKGNGKDAINFKIPASHFPAYGDSEHLLTLEAKMRTPGVSDADTSNNQSSKRIILKQTDALNVLYVSLDKAIGKKELMDFSQKANDYLKQIYPISDSSGFVGTHQGNYYLADPSLELGKSIDKDDVPIIPNVVIEAGKSFTYQSTIRTIEKVRKQYNDERCRDKAGNLIVSCKDEIADFAVGVYPVNAFGAGNDGFAYADYKDKWKAAANSIHSPKNVAHELGHLFGFPEEYDSTSPGKPVVGSTWDGKFFRTATGTCVNIMGNTSLRCNWIDAGTWNRLRGLLITSSIGGARYRSRENIPSRQASPSPDAGKVSQADELDINNQSHSTDSTSREAVQLAFWKSVANSMDPADFEAYLNRWPNGIFADLSRNRLARLSNPQTPSAQERANMPPSTYYTPTRGSAERAAIMDAARIPIGSELGQRVIFVVDQLRTDGHWVYLEAVPKKPDGSPINWNATQFADAWSEELMTDTVMALLENSNGQLRVVDYVIGPTDVYWYNWVDNYQLPEQFFFPG